MKGCRASFQGLGHWEVPNLGQKHEIIHLGLRTFFSRSYFLKSTLKSTHTHSNATMVLFRRPRMLYRPPHRVEEMTNGVHTIWCDSASKVMMADYAIREHVQREETKNKRAEASRKVAAVDCNQSPLSEEALSRLKKEDEMLERANKELREKERELYRVVSLMNQPNQDAYYTLRRDPLWFMNEGLIEDCANQGGCCSRQCGCCAERHLTGPKKGGGHCTPECWCCTIDRGCDLSEIEKKEIRDNMLVRLHWRFGNDISPYLLRMATWFFFPPKPKKKSKKIF